MVAGAVVVGASPPGTLVVNSVEPRSGVVSRSEGLASASSDGGSDTSAPSGTKASTKA